MAYGVAVKSQIIFILESYHLFFKKPKIKYIFKLKIFWIFWKVTKRKVLTFALGRKKYAM